MGIPEILLGGELVFDAIDTFGAEWFMGLYPGPVIGWICPDWVRTIGAGGPWGAEETVLIMEGTWAYSGGAPRGAEEGRRYPCEEGRVMAGNIPGV